MDVKKFKSIYVNIIEKFIYNYLQVKANPQERVRYNRT
jgi:hypothetical protein